MRKHPGSHLVNAALASGVLYWVQDLSRSGRSVIDWAVIGLVALAILWHLFSLGRRLYRFAGLRAVMQLLATVAVWIVGLFNTLFGRSELAGTWRTPVGWMFLVIALVNTVLLFRMERAATAPDRENAAT